MLVKEFNKIIDQTNLSYVGPYELEDTCKKLSEALNCQFIIFGGGLSQRKVLFMYPEIYSDNLKPIYLYQPNINHLVYIKNLPSFYRNNFRVCLCCLKTFYTKSSVTP